MRGTGIRRPFLSRLALKLLGLVILLAFVPLLFIVRTVQNNNQDLMEGLVQEIQVSHAATRAGELSAWLEARHREVAHWAADATLAALATEVDSSSAGPGGLRDRLARDLGRHRAYESLFVADASGRVLAGTRVEQLEPWARAALTEEPPPSGFRGRLGFSAELGRPTLLFVGALEEEGPPHLFLVGRVDLRDLAGTLAPDESKSPPVSYLWVDEQGGVLASAGQIERSPRTRQIKGLAGLHKSASLQVTLPGLGDALCGYDAPPALRGTALVAAVQRGPALAPARTSWRHLVVTSLVVVLFALLALGWAARAVLGPILMLSEGARRLSAGDLQVYLPVRGKDEISALTSTFNEMTRRLREGREELEEARDGLAKANQELRTVNRTLETLAITDGLTGLYNHRHFQDTLDKEIRRSDREGRPLSLVMLDLDHFKQFNDRWGHTEGDAALRRVATQIMRTVRSTDMAFRYGGEELAVLLPSCSKGQAAEVAEKIRVAVATGTRRRGLGSGITVSGGVATAPEDGLMGRGLIDAADVALYAAKARGRNCVVVAGAFPGQPSMAGG